MLYISRIIVSNFELRDDCPGKRLVDVGRWKPLSHKRFVCAVDNGAVLTPDPETFDTLGQLRPDQQVIEFLLTICGYI